jgi:Mrp family chromosome partitioning ATPase
MAGLTSPRMRQLLQEARSQFSWVIVDTPPVGLLADANLLAAMVDGVVIVVRAGDTPYDLIQRAVVTVGQQKILGVVLNAASSGARTRGYDYYTGTRAVSLPSSR